MNQALARWFALTLGAVSLTAQAQGPPNLPIKQLASDVAANEIKIIQFGEPYLRYRIHTIDSKGDQFRDVIESKDGAVARLIWKEGRALTPDEDAAERERLQAMLDSPAAYAKHVKGDMSGRKMAVDMIRTMPDAMLYTYASGQPQRNGMAGEVVIDFEPNPAWKPPTMPDEALTGLKGRIWVDPHTRTLTRMEGHIFQPVNVGLGVFAHIYPGGELAFEQGEAVKNRWIFSHFTEHVSVRALMVKTIKENVDIQGSNYTTVPPMSYQDAIKLLESTPLPTHLP